MYANDLLITGRGDPRECEILADTLQAYCKSAGQKINLTKSLIIQHPNQDKITFRYLSNKFHIPTSHSPPIYLGAPMPFGRAKKSLYNNIISNLSNRVMGWRAKLLNPAGQTTMIKSIFFFGVMKLMSEVCTQSIGTLFVLPFMREA
ncbi:hypothetical protein BVC80_8829g2 [Macleaya cordata]|uniref:Reverse transcriptase domain n=1 Tax=Macleaya cordata TaxID=56857 RepID=A0A200PSD5_MACCD|nr:hypothetical protein BVC80_8829g2 [Macleaya cordata]